MTSKVIYQGDLRCTSEHLTSHQTIITDAPLDNHGKAEAFSPTDLLATSLANCMLTVMGISARGHQIDMDGAFAEVTKHMASDPRRVSRIDVKVYFPTGKNYSDKDKKLLEYIGFNCPVNKSLHPDIFQNIEFVWLE